MELITPSVSDKKNINEMDAVEIRDYASTLYAKIDNETFTDEDRINLSTAKLNFKQLTGIPLTRATMCRV